MAHNHMLTNTNAAFAPNTERLRSQSADVISADFLLLTWLNTRHRIVVKKKKVFFFFLKSSRYWTGKILLHVVLRTEELVHCCFPSHLK